MLRRWAVVSSVSLLGLAAQARADWTEWVVVPGGPLWVHETANVPAGPGNFDMCFIIAVTDFVTANNSGEVWCRDQNTETLVTKIDTVGFASVAIDSKSGDSPGVNAPFFAVSDPATGEIWYGQAGQPPELAVSGNPARSLSLAHFSNGTAVIVYRGGNDRLYMAQRTPGGQWIETQITNNSSGDNRWSVEAVVESDILHIAYWDESWTAVRYARKDASGWTFETVKDLTDPGPPGTFFVAPAVAADSEGGAYVGFTAPDGLLHYLRRTGPGAWTERTFAPPIPAAYDDDRGPVGLVVDASKRAHFLYGTGNFGNANQVLRYVNCGPFGFWRDSTAVQTMTNNPNGYRGIDLSRKDGPERIKVLGSWASSVAGILELGCADCIE